MRCASVSALASLFVLVFCAGPVFAEEKGCDEDCPPGLLVVENGEAWVKIGGQLQVQTALYTGLESKLSNGDVAEQEGFRLRRSRIKLTGQLYRHLSFGLATEMHDKEDSGGNLLDAWFDFAPTKYFGLKAGALELPWTRSTLISSAYQSLVVRPVGVRGMAPRRQAGALLHSEVWDDRVRLQVGVYNSLHRAEGNFHAGYEEIGQSLGNRYSRFAYGARLDVAPLGAVDDTVADVDKSSSPRVNLGGGYFYSDGATRKIHGFAGDLHFQCHGFALFGGYLHETSGPAAAEDPNEVVQEVGVADITNSGWFAEADYTILRRLLGVHARYEWLDVNHDIKDEGNERTASFGVSVYALENLVRFQADYQMRMEPDGVEVDNDILLTQIGMAF